MLWYVMCCITMGVSLLLSLAYVGMIAMLVNLSLNSQPDLDGSGEVYLYLNRVPTAKWGGSSEHQNVGVVSPL